MVEKNQKLFQLMCRHRVGFMADLMLKNALLYPDRTAFVYDNQRETYKEYNDHVNQLVHALRDKGLKKGDVLGVLSWNSIEYAEVFGAAEKGGFITAPINTRLSADEISYLIKDSESRVLFIGREFKELVEKLRPAIPGVKHFIGLDYTDNDIENYSSLLSNFPLEEPVTDIHTDDPLFICYTSGTAGLPKGALYTHGRFRESVMNFAINVPLANDCVYTGQMPLFHIGGIRGRAYLMTNAARHIILRKFDAEKFAQLISAEKVTEFGAVPTQIAMWMDLPDFEDYDFSSLTGIRYAASPMPFELLKKILKKFGPICCQGFGQTESGPSITFLKEPDHDVTSASKEKRQRLKSCGRPAFGVQVRIVDENRIDLPSGQVGEIIAKSNHIMKEYWKKPEETRKKIVDGWLHTGDMGYYDNGGYIFLVDRKEDMIVTGGENVYPREVEEILYKHPSVRECSVFGIPDPKWVEAVHAVVALRQGMTTTPEELIAFSKTNLTGYKAPKSIDIMDELPKNATGKIMKRKIKEKYWIKNEVQA
jgi:acyl-CoA synthetase (AMP-forming)/AMP-acid ligase II